MNTPNTINSIIVLSVIATPLPPLPPAKTNKQTEGRGLKHLFKDECTFKISAEEGSLIPVGSLFFFPFCDFTNCGYVRHIVHVKIIVTTTYCYVDQECQKMYQ